MIYMENVKYKVIKLRQVTFDKLIKEGKPFNHGESTNDVFERIISKLEKSRKKKK